MLPLTEPQKPGASDRSWEHMEILFIISLASPINIAPFKGLVIVPLWGVQVNESKYQQKTYVQTLLRNIQV